MKRRRGSTQFLLYFLMMMFLMVIGCSGGGGDAAPTSSAKTISGIAAGGGPIIGTVTIKDSSSPAIERVSTIAADGSYSIDVFGMTAPFALRADGYVGGREYHLYSAAVSADINGKINITPFTDLIIANMISDIAENFYNSDKYKDLTPEALAVEEAKLRTILKPVLTAMGVSDTIDLLRTSFDANHTGLDKVIDAVQVSVDPATVKATLTNVLNGDTVTVNIDAGGTSSGDLSGDGMEDSAAALQAITNMWTTFTSLFATNLPSPSNATLLSLLADEATFLESGMDRNSWLTEMTTNGSMIGISITNVALKSIDLAAGTAEVTFTVMQNGIIMSDGPGICNMVKQGGTWRYAGNGRIISVDVEAHADYSPYYSGASINTGLALKIDGNYPAGAVVQSAVFKGPGLPTGGVILNKQIEYDWFSISGNGGNVYSAMDDSTIGAIPDNAEYTIKLYNAADGGGTLIATYKETLRKRPLKLSELSSASFPVITAPTQAALQAFNGGSLTVSWTLPAGLYPAYVSLYLSGSGGTESMQVRGDSLRATDTSKTLTGTPAWTVKYRNLHFAAEDTYGRSFQIDIW